MTQTTDKPFNITQLSPEQCKTIYLVIKKNAISHFAAAEILAASADYANAIGHLILGAEELINSFFLMLLGSDFPVRTITNYNKLFYTHTARHNVLKELYSAYWFFTQLNEWPKKNKKHSTFQHYFTQFKYLVDSVNNSVQNHGGGTGQIRSSKTVFMSTTIRMVLYHRIVLIR